MFNPNMHSEALEAQFNGTAATTTTANVSSDSNASNSTDTRPVQSWPLMAFRKLYKRMQYCPNQVNRTTGETFKSLAFTKADNTIDFVHFSRNLGVLTPNEIMTQKHDLQVCLLASGTYSLCRIGHSSWLDMDLNE